MVYKFCLSILFLFVSLTSGAVPTGNDFLKLIGQPVTNPQLSQLYNEIEFGQHNSSFDRTNNIYELNSFEKGISLFFNQNFILKEIHFYDSGYLYQRFKGELPLTMDLAMNQAYFDERYTNFEADESNPFLYISSFAGGNISVYFKGNHIEKVKLVGSTSFIDEQDRVESENWGMRMIPDGKCVSGNCFTGTGNMRWESTLQYDGAWNYGIAHGTGMLFDSAGFKYAGGFKLGFLWGEGNLTVPTQYIYKGNFMLGKKYGYGEIRYQNGSKYQGDWQNDQMHGKGHFYFSAQYHYQGEMANNQFNGRGILYTPEGYIECGFKDGKPHGKGKQVATKNNSSLSGQWVNGLKEGNFEVYTPNLGNYTAYFENDIEISKAR